MLAQVSQSWFRKLRGFHSGILGFVAYFECIIYNAMTKFMQIYQTILSRFFLDEKAQKNEE